MALLGGGFWYREARERRAQVAQKQAVSAITRLIFEKRGLLAIEAGVEAAVRTDVFSPNVADEEEETRRDKSLKTWSEP